MDSVRNVFSFTLNWNPAYSYSELPKGYNYETIPAHWKSMLQKVTPVEKGIPHAKDIYVSNLKVTNAQNIFTASGLEQSWLTNFVYSNSVFGGDVIGPMEFTKGWKFNNIIFDIQKNKPAPKPVSREILEMQKQ